MVALASVGYINYMVYLRSFLLGKRLGKRRAWKMKVCRKCECVYLNQLDKCPECGSEEFDELLVACYDDAETWE